MSRPDAWDGILDEDERILWQGRPDGGITLRPRNIFMVLFGAAFAGFALFWMVMASQAGGGFWMFGLIHFSVGIALMFGALFGGAWKRRHTWYTLTDRRGFIATDLPVQGKKLKSYPIDSDTVLEFQDGTFQSVLFARETKRGKDRSYTVPVGFERLTDGRDVYRLMRDIQARAASSSETDAT